MLLGSACAAASCLVLKFEVAGAAVAFLASAAAVSAEVEAMPFLST